MLTQAGLQAKQVVRNVESALLAQLGVRVDHRRISVAQTAEVKPIVALEATAVREASLKRPVVFRGISIRPADKLKVAISVTLEVNGEERVGHEEVADAEKSRIQGAARATVAALDYAVGDGAVELEGAKIVEAFDLAFVMVGVQVLDGRHKLLLVGTCEIRDSAPQAAALAVLDATNRWLQGQARG